MTRQPTTSIFNLLGGIIVAFIVLVGFNSFVIINQGQAVDVYDITVQKFEVPAQSSTKDLQDLSASFAINFRLDPVKVVEIRRTQGTLRNIVTKIIAPQTQESFKIAAARRTVEEAITKRSELKEDFDTALNSRLEKYGIIVLDTSVVDLAFSTEFAKAVEEKQIAEQRAQRAVYVAQEASQEAQADINRAKGKAEAQRLLAETLKAQGGELVLQKEAIEAWRTGGAQMPRVLVMGKNNASVPFIFDLNNVEK